MHKRIPGLSLSTVLLASTATLCAATFTVTNTSDSGPGSLRQAILDANALEGDDLIAIQHPGPGCPHDHADQRTAAHGGNYCRYDPITRGQMAVFLTKTFRLQ